MAYYKVLIEVWCDWDPEASALARIIREVEGAKSLLCYKHVVETVFAATQEASA